MLAPSARPRTKDGLFDGWLANAMDIVIAPLAPTGRFEFRADSEIASLVDGEVLQGPIDDPGRRGGGDPDAIYSLFVDRCFDLVTVDGRPALLEQLLEAAPGPDRGADHGLGAGAGPRGTSPAQLMPRMSSTSSSTRYPCRRANATRSRACCWTRTAGARLGLGRAHSRAAG